MTKLIDVVQLFFYGAAILFYVGAALCVALAMFRVLAPIIGVYFTSAMAVDVAAALFGVTLFALCGVLFGRIGMVFGNPEHRHRGTP